MCVCRKPGSTYRSTAQSDVNSSRFFHDRKKRKSFLLFFKLIPRRKNVLAHVHCAFSHPFTSVDNFLTTYWNSIARWAGVIGMDHPFGRMRTIDSHRYFVFLVSFCVTRKQKDRLEQHTSSVMLTHLCMCSQREDETNHLVNEKERPGKSIQPEETGARLWRKRKKKVSFFSLSPLFVSCS